MFPVSLTFLTVPSQYCSASLCGKASTLLTSSTLQTYGYLKQLDLVEFFLYFLNFSFQICVEEGFWKHPEESGRCRNAQITLIFHCLPVALGSEPGALLDSLWKEARLDRKRQIFKR